MARNRSVFDLSGRREAAQKLGQIEALDLEDLKQAVHGALVEMNRKAALKGPPVRSLQEILARKSQKELNRYVRAYGLKNLGGAKKEAILARLAEAMADPQWLENEIRDLDMEEWDFFARALETGTTEDELTAPDMIKRLLADGYVHVFDDDGRIIYAVPDEVRAAYAALDAEYLNAFKEMQTMLDTFARAAVNLYGVLEQKEFLRLLERHLFKGKAAGLGDDLYEAFLETYDGRCGDYTAWKEYLITWELLDDGGDVPSDVVESLVRSREGKPRYDPGREALLEYADSDYYEETPQVAALRGALERFGVGERAVKHVLCDLHDAIVGEQEDNAMFRVLADYTISLEPEQLQTVLRLSTDMSNHTRLWSNYGHTPAEILAMKGGAPRAAGDAAMRPQPAAPAGNIPRNGPCPCGSGKKYKHCCGRDR